MVKAYSFDLRERVVRAVVAGATTRVVADRFGIAVSSVVKWHQRFRAVLHPARWAGIARLF